MGMAMPTPIAAGNGAILQRKCATCKEEDESNILRMNSDGQMLPGGEAPDAVYHALRSREEPLEPATRRFFEPRFGVDLGSIRVHHDDVAARAASSVGALAYTAGRHIFFGQGRYSPHTTDGKRLLAHELTHTIQQGGAEAHAPIARTPVQPELGITAASSPLLQRQCAEYTARNCMGKPCMHSTGGAGFCRWSGSVRIGCVCIKIDNRFTEFVERVLHAALIALGITIAAAALVAVVACFASGLCELGALLGAAAAALLAFLLGTSKEAGAASLDATAPETGTGPGKPVEGPAKEPRPTPTPTKPSPSKTQVTKPSPAPPVQGTASGVKKPAQPGHPASVRPRSREQKGSGGHEPAHPATGIKIIEGVNLSRVEVGKVYGVSSPKLHKYMILQAISKETKGSDTTVEFVSTLECDPNSCDTGGNIYVVTHPYRESEGALTVEMKELQ